MYWDVPPKQRVLVIDDVEEFRQRMKNHLSSHYEVETASGWVEGKKKLKNFMPNIILLDYKLEDGYDGIDVVRELKRERYDNLIIILVSAYLEQADIEAAWEIGVDAVVSKNKPEKRFEHEISKAVLENIAKRVKKLENRKTKERTIEPVFESPAMQKVHDQVLRFRNNEENLLITGEHGCGKEVLAAFIHLRSYRASGPFYILGLPRLTSELFSKEFYGHVRGAYTDAPGGPGLLELAHLGTLVLDEVGEVNMENQPKLLRMLEHKSFRRDGGKRELNTNVRFIALTNKDLEEEVRKGRFKEDLYHRLKTFHIEVPPLRRRKEDIPLLARQILRRESENRMVMINDISPELEEIMLEYSWPGNVRELEEWIKNGITYASSDVLRVEDVPQASRAAAPGNSHPLPDDMMYHTYDRFKYESVRLYLIHLLESTSGKMGEAARRAGIMRPALYRLCKKHCIDPADYREK